MANLQFRLQTLLKLRTAERQRRLSELADALRAEFVLQSQHRELARQRTALREQLRLSSRPGAVDVDRLLETHRHGLLLETRQKALELQSRELHGEIGRRQGALADADRQVKVLEKVRQRQQEAHDRETLRQEQKLMDEVSLRSQKREAP